MHSLVPTHLSSHTLCEVSPLFLWLQPTSLVSVLQYLAFSFPPQDRHLHCYRTWSVLPILLHLINFSSSFRAPLMHRFLKEAGYHP